MSNIHIIKKEACEHEHEFVERKGIGHPDTLADALAEHLSVEYSKYTLNKFGAILHHNFDKVGLLGGASYVTFGKGYLIQPIRILLNGRASTKFGNEELPVKKLLISWSKEFMILKFPMINSEKDLEFHYNLSNQSSPGKTDEFESTNAPRKHWFEPRNLNDLPELKKLVSNDTSLGVGYAPLTALEQLIIKIEGTLNSAEFKSNNPWTGSDIKLMGFRYRQQFGITMCIPQIANHVLSIEDYKSNLNQAKDVIHKIASDFSINRLDLNINTRDNLNTIEIYLTAVGSSIESGDEGLVGRGNRINGLISPTRPMSMEGSCGKNPVYHIGKLYYIAANEISRKIYEKFGIANEVALVSQSGRDLLDPWVTFVSLPKNFSDVKLVQKMVGEEIKLIPQITNLLLAQKIKLY
jgi:S-adenosylmethionine synthetase